MSNEKVQVHRPGAFKQINKPHKHGAHRSKGAIDLANKGRTSVKNLTKKKKNELNREQRRLQATQIRKNKREEVLINKRLGNLDGNSCPHLVCILSLNRDYDPIPVLSKLKESDPENIILETKLKTTHLTIPRFKQKFTFILPNPDNEFGVLDALKVSNTVVFVVSAAAGIEFSSEVIDKYGSRLLLSSFGQGLPTPVIIVTDLETIPQKKRNDRKITIQNEINKWFPNEKVVTLDKNSDALNVLRKIGSQKQKGVTYRDRRPHLLVENYNFIDEQDGKGTLKVSGFLRGTPLSANDLVYIPGLGHYQITQIDAPPNPFDTKSSSTNTLILQKADSQQLQIQEINQDRPETESEQMMETIHEIDEILHEEKELNQKRMIKKVPKGWSNYQAAWIPDEEAELKSDDDDLSEDDQNDSNYMDAMSEEISEYSDAEEDNFDTMTVSEIPLNDKEYDEQFDLKAEKADYEKLKAAKSDLMFPDEVDTPMDIAARKRFERYRGLESFRTSPWDPHENLPEDYSKIFKFKNFDQAKKTILSNVKDREIKDIQKFVTIHVKNVPWDLWQSLEDLESPIILFGLLPHETNMSVVNVVLKRTGLYDEPIKSKERFIFQCGYRRFMVQPIFSQHTNGNKHKFERFFHPNSTAVATFFAPIQFPPSPVLCYKETDGNLTLIATGSVLSCNPDRIILKRIVLSGYPFKIHKRSAVVRFMFFNREDITYFKPCKLHTKYGREGHIKEPLGTHGHMKCVFKHQLKSQDTVLMTLYKRVFPKWKYQDCSQRWMKEKDENNVEMTEIM
ncbi:pre-rRNA-processing protein TSR1 homolog [Onthophagus taurus]|uniref:pre-rRNA-processing protein TSR1 homolog n=1 Tax=Onthophagus taurus TaxID=166361 RepID=UPI0039BE99CB